MRSNASLLPHLAHELRTPLGGLSAALDVLSFAAELDPQELCEALAIAKRQIDRLASLTDLLDILGAEARETREVDLKVALAPAWALACAEKDLPDVPLLPEQVMVDADQELLYKALLCLARYALGNLPKSRPSVMEIGKEVVIAIGDCNAAKTGVALRLPVMVAAAAAAVATFNGKITLHGSANIEGVTLFLPRSLRKTAPAEP